MTGGREIQTRDNTSGGWGWIEDSLTVIFHLIGRLRYKVPTHHITHGARRRQYDTLPAWQQDASSPLHTANTHMCRYIYNQSWCSHHYRPLHFPLFAVICDITGIRDTEILALGSLTQPLTHYIREPVKKKRGKFPLGSYPPPPL